MAKSKTQKKRTPKKALKRGKTAKKAAGGKADRKASKKKVARTSSKSAGRRTTAAEKRSKTSGRASKPARKRFKSAMLVDQSHQIYCEAQMLRSVVSVLTGSSSSLPISVEDRACRNTFNESFCLHFRTLLDFFWEGRAGKKEAVARDFFATPRRWRPEKPQDYRDLKKRLAKEINALTTSRYNDLEIEEWPYRRIFDEIFVAIDRFQSTAPQENLHTCWRERPIAALSGEGTRASMVAGPGLGDDVPPPKVESGAPELELTGTGATRTEVVGSAFSGAESLRPAWSTTGDDVDEHEHDGAQTEASREPIFARDFGALGNDED